MTSINEWLDKEDAHASSEIQWMDAYPARAQATYKQRAEKEITLATNALLRAALKWAEHHHQCPAFMGGEDYECLCGYDEKVQREKELAALIEGEK